LSYAVVKTMTFDRIAAAIATALPVELTEDVRKNVRAALRSALEKMDLVTREEMEVQEKVLLRTREKLESLLIRLDQLERKLHDEPPEEHR
tara:strand:+ start:42 stop:314 length:273 start_codon:yes stop_codon:yes gene_type:complete